MYELNSAIHIRDYSLKLQSKVYLAGKPQKCNHAITAAWKEKKGACKWPLKEENAMKLAPSHRNVFIMKRLIINYSYLFLNTGFPILILI